MNTYGLAGTGVYCGQTCMQAWSATDVAAQLKRKKAYARYQLYRIKRSHASRNTKSTQHACELLSMTH
eukprot:6212069-Pleurochrysis_carterae.AAC.2